MEEQKQETKDKCRKGRGKVENKIEYQDRKKKIRKKKK